VLPPDAHTKKSSTDNDPSELERAVSSAFGADGPLAKDRPQYRVRQSQTDMAVAIAKAINTCGTLAVEAATGVGKTYAYLVPVLLSGQRAVLSTATKGLQDQLFNRDLPRVREALGLTLTTALLKGRESYLCLHRMKQARDQPALSHRVSLRTLAKIERWSQATRTGDLGEVEGLDESTPLKPWITSTRDNCLGSACSDFQACHVVRARREALAADVVVVNHHLYFADQSLRETGMAELLPTVDVVVFDEAHHLVDIGVQFLGSSLSTAQAVDLARDVLAQGLKQARGLAPWSELAAGVDRAARDIRLALPPSLQSRAGWPKEDEALRDALQHMVHAAQQALDALNSCSELDPAFGVLASRCAQLGEMAERFLSDTPSHDPDDTVDDAPIERVRWIDVASQHARLIESPLDIAQALTQHRQKAQKTWIFTSATLGEDDKLSWFTQPTGLLDDPWAQTLRVSSPFNHAQQAKLWICNDAPKPDQAGHADHVAHLAFKCATTLQGRTIVLTTTLRAMQKIGETMRSLVKAQQGELRITVQGEASKNELLHRLANDQPGTVLVATQSFWEGVDVAGDALQCVVIDKLPFPPPGDPLIEARARRVESMGGSAFNTCFVAEAAMALKQGSGRLIRSESDRGLLVIADPRMGSMGYGKRLQRALPPMGVVQSEAQALDWLQELSRDHAPW
jgi:ATP-dependent DNA helicase DinG